MKEDIKAILLLDWIIIIVCYIIAIIINNNEYGFNFIASIFIAIVVDLCLLLESIKFLRKIFYYFKLLCYKITIILILFTTLTPADLNDLPNIVQVIFTVSGVASIFFFVYDLIFNGLEQNTSKSGLHPNAEK